MDGTVPVGDASRGPLTGLRVIEMGGIGPGPFCGMMLADLGADVARVDQLPGPGDDPDAWRHKLLNRGKRSIAVNLKHPGGRSAVLALAGQADVLIDVYRPGVMERLGLGPEQCHAASPRLIYARMTGFGQSGPKAQDPGHDLNYLAQSGALALVGRKDQPPTPPLSLVGDFGGGGMLLALAIVAALLAARETGRGQVIDAAMSDGAALLATPFFGLAHTGDWKPERGVNLIDSGAPFYDVYQASDGRWVTVAAIEPKFYASLLRVLGLHDRDLPDQYDRAQWPGLKELIAAVIRTRTRDEWVRAAAGQQACLEPMLELGEAAGDPHNVARGTFVTLGGVTQPAPAPRFSQTRLTVSGPPPAPGEHSVQVLQSWGIDREQVNGWTQSGAVAQAELSIPERHQEPR